MLPNSYLIPLFCVLKWCFNIAFRASPQEQQVMEEPRYQSRDRSDWVDSSNVQGEDTASVPQSDLTPDCVIASAEVPTSHSPPSPPTQVTTALSPNSASPTPSPMHNENHLPLPIIDPDGYVRLEPKGRGLEFVHADGSTISTTQSLVYDARDNTIYSYAVDANTMPPAVQEPLLEGEDYPAAPSMSRQSSRRNLREPHRNRLTPSPTHDNALHIEQAPSNMELGELRLLSKQLETLTIATDTDPITQLPPEDDAPPQPKPRPRPSSQKRESLLAETVEVRRKSSRRDR